MAQRLVILTRPGDADQDLMRHLSQEGIQVWHWPAFSVYPSDQPETITSTIRALGSGDMVVFVSPTSVVMTHEVLPVWPKEVAIGCAGIATAKIARALWGQSVNPIYPGQDVAQSGSEALFALLKERGFPKRVVIARAQSGREWFAERMREVGVPVEPLCVYYRHPLVLDENGLDSLRDALTGEPPILYVTSSEAFASLLGAVSLVSGAQEWLRKANVLTIHERCLARAREHGFARVELVDTASARLYEAIARNLASG